MRRAKGKKTTNYYYIEKFLQGCFDELEQNHFSKWVFMKACGVKVQFLNGKSINYNGVGFQGSPQNIFWDSNYIPEYMKDYCFKGIEKALENSDKFKINPNKCLDELREQLYPKIKISYERMSDIEARLLGNGFKIPPQRNTKRYTESIKNDIDKIIESHKKSVSYIVVFCLKKHLPLGEIFSFVKKWLV